METTVKRQEIRNGIKATIRAGKDGKYQLIVYHDNGSGLIQTCDIITAKTYYNERAAKSALYRITKQLTRQQEV